ncbi:MAG: hypothetical protein H0W12_01710 [Chitinophagaceae bacterium]|nr:hypothetical protein [Chitinophagaceae bacterium]
MVTEKQLANLRPAKSGEVRNRNGAPKKLPDLKILIATELTKEVDGKTNAERILAALQKKAEKGDVRAAELLLDRAYGKAHQHIQIEDVTNRERVIRFSDGQIKRIG